MISTIARACTQVYIKTLVGPWQEWFAWYPVEVYNKHIWLKKVCRRKITYYVDMEGCTRYEYGTLFDIIKE